MSMRKSLHTLQKAAGDKENLVGPGRMPLTVEKEPLKDNLREVNENNDKAQECPPKLLKRKKTASKGVQAGALKKGSSSTVTENDLTGDTPSEKYWETLSEQRRVALEATLLENSNLHLENEELRKKIAVLQEENSICKELLKESETLVEVLKEMIGGDSINDESQLIDNSYEA